MKGIGYDRYRKMRKDEEKGGEYYKKSCNDGYPYACNDIAKIIYQYEYNDEAAQYYKKTCELIKILTKQNIFKKLAICMNY